MIGRKVCDICCWKCKHHRAWSGIWHCSYRSEDARKKAALNAKRNEFDTEVLRISDAYRRRKKEEARQQAIKDARARARYAREHTK